MILSLSIGSPRRSRQVGPFEIGLALSAAAAVVMLFLMVGNYL